MTDPSPPRRSSCRCGAPLYPFYWTARWATLSPVEHEDSEGVVYAATLAEARNVFAAQHEVQDENRRWLYTPHPPELYEEPPL